MVFNLFRRGRSDDDTIRLLYGAIVAQARHPAFYAAYRVPDTVDGRFDMIVLHLGLVIRRLRSAPPASRVTSQRLFDLFCSDMEHNLREMGVSDLAVPKEMRRFGEAFYGRLAVYDRALDAGDEAALVAALARNVFGDEAGGGGARRLAHYVRAVEGELAAQDVAVLARGHLKFAAPADLAAADPQ